MTSQRKRSRLTPVNGMSDDDDDDASIVSSIRNAHAMQEDELESDDEEVMAQAARLHANGDEIVNRAADFGIIEEVHCKNFMCHANLTMKLGPLINFIIGHNGSGKSAVLTALQLCLGGKATSTNRGQSLKHFIKTGCEQCTLSVKIKNQGELAYEPRKYGDSIIVERVFTRNGTSNFKLKSADGKLQANKKGDLDEMLDALGLMMDNPMNVLTQDMARQFLNSSNAVEKYKFFYQGTQLEQLDNDYRILEESLQQNQEQEHNLKASAQAAKQHYEAAEKKAQMAERAATLQEQYNGLSRQMAWIQVQEQEETLAHMEGDIRRQEGVIEDRKAKFAEMDASKEEYARARDEAKEALDSLNADVAAKAGERDSIKEDFESTKTKLMESIAQQRSIKSEIESAQKTVERLQTSIEQEREKIASADNGRHAQKLDEIQAAEDQLASMREDEQQKSSESRVFDVAVRDAKAKLDDAHKAKDKGEAAVKGSENRIAAFERERGDWRQAYSPRLPALLKAIEQDGRFKEKPVGPLGRYVKLLQPKWADILEQSSGGALNAFAVTTKGDQVILSDLMRRSNYNGQIYVTTSRPFDTSQNEPPEQYDTWMRVLRIESSIVRNCLIINQSIDKTLLEEDPEKAKDMISRRIPNVQQIFSKNPVLGDGRTRWGYRFALTSGGGEAAAPIQPWKGGARMQTDTESQIA
jgi:chromosome segregation ATPase